MKTHQCLMALAAMRARCTQRQHRPPTPQTGAPWERDAVPSLLPPTAPVPLVPTATAVVDFWREAGPALWFAKDARSTGRSASASCRCTRRRRAASSTAGWQRRMAHWRWSLLLDQFPRNAFRDTARMYATDARARRVADAAIDAGHDRAVDGQLQLFFYLPFGHSENLADQERSVALGAALGEPNLSHAKGHRDIIRRFGRFPHRNPILGRTMRPEEQQFLDTGGFAG